VGGQAAERRSEELKPGSGLQSNQTDAGAVAIRVSGEGGWDTTPSPLHAQKERWRRVTFDGWTHTPTIRTGAP
jgi:hypothetical protein